jgi:hypothetical protein
MTTTPKRLAEAARNVARSWDPDQVPTPDEPFTVEECIALAFRMLADELDPPVITYKDPPTRKAASE